VSKEDALPEVPLNWREQYAWERRREGEQQVWQLPALSLTAQSFLYSQGVASTTSGPARIVVAIVGLVTAIATAAILINRAARNRMWRAVLDGCRTKRDAAPLGWDAMRRHVGTNYPKDRESSESADRWVSKHLTPRTIWLFVLAVFALADLFVLAVGITETAGGDWDPF
jgi:hypothetical protein